MHRRLIAASRSLTLLTMCALPAALLSQSTNPASVPAGALTPKPPAPAPAATNLTVTPRQAREADDAYLAGAKEVARKDLAAALPLFERAVQLNPTDRDYVLALYVTRGNRVDQLVQLAAKARLIGDNARADDLLAQARDLDPTNPVIAQHFNLPTTPVDLTPAERADLISPTLAGPIELTPTAGTHDFHLQGDAQTVLRNVYTTFGITPTFDSSVSSGYINVDLDHLDFAGATRVVQQLTHTFAVPVQAKSVLIARDTPDKRDELMPLIEETVYLPGITGDQMTELANLARNVFDLKQVTASLSNGYMLLRGDEPTLKLVNATYADMLDAGSDVMFDLNLYELDKTHVNNIGATLPTSASVFSIQQEAEKIDNANQSLLNTIISGGNIQLTGNRGYDRIIEALALIASGAASDANVTNLIALIGKENLATLANPLIIPLAGIAVSGTSTFNLSLNSSDTRLLDSVKLRSSNGQAASFRAGSRYPVVTGTYSSGVSSALASAAAGLNINGTSVSSLLNKYLGTSTSIPQFQFEDLGITLKITPTVLHGNEVQLKLDLKLEALAGTSLNSIPVLNNRAMTSTITIPTGDTAMLAAYVSSNEIGSIAGLPGLSELPGFQGTDKDVEHDSSELLITITPHVVRQNAMRIASRRLAVEHTGPAAQ
jgi:hypothetical protein